jgi:hypothetical protein
MAKGGAYRTIAVAEAWMGDVAGAVKSVNMIPDKPAQKCHCIVEIAERIFRPEKYENRIERMLQDRGML